MGGVDSVRYLELRLRALELGVVRLLLLPRLRGHHGHYAVPTLVCIENQYRSTTREGEMIARPSYDTT